MSTVAAWARWRRPFTGCGCGDAATVRTEAHGREPWLIRMYSTAPARPASRAQYRVAQRPPLQTGSSIAQEGVGMGTFVSQPPPYHAPQAASVMRVRSAS
jgi:hypothetical protein